MGVEGCQRIIKYLLFGFNLIFWLLGCAIMVIGLIIRLSPETQKIFEGGEFYILNSVHAGAYVLIAVGGLMMVIGFFGCCGAIRENQCLLVTFFICLFLLFLVLLSCAIWAFVTLQVRGEETKKELTDIILNKVATYSQAPDFMDNLQQSIACCGAHNSTDYGRVGQNVPPSCGDAVIDTIQYDSGCAEKILTTFRDGIFFIGVAGLTVAIVLIFGMMFSMCLVRGIRNGDYVA